MWTKENRARYDRSGLRYESDLTEEEWAEIAPLIPPARPGGNRRTVNLREVVVVRAVIRLPADSSQEKKAPLILTTLDTLTTRHR